MVKHFWTENAENQLSKRFLKSPVNFKECGCFHLTSQKSDKDSCLKHKYEMKRSKIIDFEYKKLWREEYSLLLSA